LLSSKGRVLTKPSWREARGESKSFGFDLSRKNLESTVVLGSGKENASALMKALEKETGIEVKGR
jgi:hypothetical protein